MNSDFTKPAPRLDTMTPEAGQALLDALWLHVRTLEQRIRDLEERLNQNSRNSSKPPSSDGPGAGQKPRKPKRGKIRRKQGGQPGHEGHSRELVPPERVDHVEECFPEPQCGCSGDVVSSRFQPIRHQVFEIPEIRPHITEYQLFTGYCTRCGKRHVAKLPTGVSGKLLGPRLMSWVAILSGCYHLSRRKVQRLLDELLGLPVSLGTLSNAEDHVSEALAQPVDEAKEHIKNRSFAHLDETSHKRAGDRGWLWVAVTATISVFIIRTSRGGKVARELLGEWFNGILISDRWSGYSWFPPHLRQLCWAHLLRDFTKISERSGQSGRVGEDLLAYTWRMFHIWHKIRDGTMDRKHLVPCMKPIQVGIESALERGAVCGNAKTEGTCKKILALKQALWTFVTIEGIEPTNNVAERTIRPYVLWRKISFGAQSERGERFMERILTVSATCQQQSRSVLEFVTHAVTNHFLSIPAPSLIPEASRSNLSKVA